MDGADRTPMRVLLTGVAGMLGHNLARDLAGAGHKVLGVDLAPSALRHPNVETVQADVRDVHRLYRILHAAGPIDAIVHGGGVSGSMVMRDNPAQIVDINVTGTTNLLEAARLHGIRRFVQCSTIMVYGPVPSGSVVEDRALAPVNVYGATKVASEALVRSYASENGFSAAILRIAHVYGPARATYCPIRAMIAGAIEGRPVEIADASGTIRQFVHSDDVVRALKLAVADRSPGCVVANVGPGVAWSMAEVADLVRAQVGPVPVSFAAGDPSPDYQTAALAIDRAWEAWRWRPEIDLGTGLKTFAVALQGRERTEADS